MRKFVQFILDLFTSTANNDGILLPTIQHSTNISPCIVFKQNQLSATEQNMRIHYIKNK